MATMFDQIKVMFGREPTETRRLHPKRKEIHSYEARDHKERLRRQ
jgi:hypothetical protein